MQRLLQLEPITAVQCIENACALPAKEPILGNIEFEIEWTGEALKAIHTLYGNGTGAGQKKELPLMALPPLECLPAEGDVLFLGPDKDKQKHFIVQERQYHHEGGADWTIVLIVDVLA